jgi:hypothetical protein
MTWNDNQKVSWHLHGQQPDAEGHIPFALRSVPKNMHPCSSSEVKDSNISPLEGAVGRLSHLKRRRKPADLAAQVW